MTKWDDRYMGVAKEVSTWSRDPSSKIGAVTVGSKGQLLSQGYNGFPRGIRDESERWNVRETKYRFVVHAEMNAIYNATYNGVSLDGATMYVYGLPCCHECAKGIIQVGIKKVVMGGDVFSPRWKESSSLAIEMFEEVGIEVCLLPSETSVQ